MINFPLWLFDNDTIERMYVEAEYFVAEAAEKGDIEERNIAAAIEVRDALAEQMRHRTTTEVATDLPVPQHATTTGQQPAATPSEPEPKSTTVFSYRDTDGYDHLTTNFDDVIKVGRVYSGLHTILARETHAIADRRITAADEIDYHAPQVEPLWQNPFILIGAAFVLGLACLALGMWLGR